MKEKRNSSSRRRTDTFQLEALEPRLLFSADAASVFAGAGDAAALFQESYSQSSSAIVAQANQSSQIENSAIASVELVLVDRSLEGADWIADQLLAQNQPERIVHFIDSDRDGVDQISELLARYEQVSSVQLFSHGGDAELLLGNTTLGMSELLGRADQVSAWADTLTTGADLLIYGCDLTGSDEGQAFALLLGELTRADIAASNNLTGNSALGGDWNLEYQSGTIEADAQLAATALEDYQGVMTIFHVTHGSDVTYEGSLRKAIDEANLAGGTNQIVFDFTGTVTPLSELPAFESPIEIDGEDKIVLDGSSAGPANGLNLLSGADNSIISNLQIIKFSGDGIALDNAWYVTLTGNHVGTLIGADGTLENGNSGNGISLLTASEVQIGDGQASGANVISNNGLHGISISGLSSHDNFIVVNYIGTNEDGTAAIGNSGSGIYIGDSANRNTLIANVISGNSSHGVNITGSSSRINLLTLNMIGTTADGLSALGNGEDGVRIELGANNNNIGRNAVDSANVISGNGGDGVTISGENTSDNLVLGNLIGTNINGDNALANGRHGVMIYNGAQNNEVGGSGDHESNLISGNTSNGVTIDGEFGTTTIGNIVRGNLIGSDITATLAIGNQDAGIDIVNGSSNNRIGGDRSNGQGNVIVANEEGIKLGDSGTDGNIILGNYIGTNADDSASLGNTVNGITIWGGASNNVIGGTGNAEGNIISGNGANGITITGSGSTGTLVKANLIGTNSTGSTALGNGYNGIGIYSGASDSILGGRSGSGEGNLISGNVGNGIELWGGGTDGNRIEGNRIGTSLDGNSSVKNELSGILITDGASSNVIGGSFIDGTGNLISGNTDSPGINLYGNTTSGNIIKGNRIGTNEAGNAKLPNQFGIYSFGAPGTIIGGSSAGEENVISGNTLDGIKTFAASASASIQGNYLGTDASGTLNIGNGYNGITIQGAVGDIIIGGANTGEENIISGNGHYGITLFNAAGVEILGNHIGVDASGLFAIANNLGGMDLDATSTNNQIGGSAIGQGNIISGNNGSGITLRVGADNNTLSGNIIGLAVNGVALMGNFGHGVVIYSSSNRVGGSGSNDRNLIGANTAHGLYIAPGGIDNVIAGNSIGTDQSATVDAGNGGHGIWLESNGNLVGGTLAGSGNTIAFNNGHGIQVQGTATANALLGNTTWQNGGIGIDLDGDMITDNDQDDVDSGANNLQNFPVIGSATTNESGSLTVSGLIQSTANTTLRIEFFTSSTLDASGHGDARVFAGYTTVLTDGSGSASFDALLAATVADGDYITATATVDGGNAVFSDTSEYALSVAAVSTVSTANTAPEFSTGTGFSQVDFGALTSDAVDMAIQADGKYLVLSKIRIAANGGDYNLALTRFNADGSLDTGFGSNGIVISGTISDNEYAKALSVQSDGKIIVAGIRDLGGYDEAMLLRYNSDGSLDTTFGMAGETSFSITGTTHTALKDITLMTDGRIVGTGFVIVGGVDAMVAVRLTSDGQLDTTFNSTGFRIIDTGAGNAVGIALQVQTDDKIVLAGQRDNGSTDEARIVRLNVDGTLDTTFSGSGQLTIVASYDLRPAALAIADDGKIVIGGDTNAAGEPSNIIRLLTNGSFDTSFAGSGYITVNAGNPGETVEGLSIQTDGSIVVVGSANNGADDDVSVFRLNANGSLDTSLDSDGLVRLDLSGAADTATTVVVDSSGRIMIAGESDDQMFIASILENGVLDTRFNVTDSLTASPSFTEDGSPVVLDAGVAVFDSELSASDNFSGATLTLVRDSAVNSDDVFGFTDGNGLSLFVNQIIKNGQTIASFDTSSQAGQLSLVFTDSFGEIPTNADIDHALQQISYANTNDNPEAQIQLNWSMSDGNTGVQGGGGSLFATGQTTVNITASNDAPEITSDGGGLSADIDIEEGDTAVTVVTASDVDTDAVLTYSLFGSPDQDKFVIGSGSGILSLIEAADYETQTDYTVIVKVTDESGASDFQVIDVHVNDSNDAPLFVTAAALPDATEDSAYSIDITTSDPDTGDTRVFTASGLPDWLTMVDNLDGTATLSGTPLQGDIASVSFTLTVEDAGGLSSSRTFSLSIQNVNDPALFTSEQTFTVAENTLAAASLTSSDEDGDTPEYAIAGGADAALFSIDAATGVLSFKAAPDFENPLDSDGDNIHEVSVTVTDNIGPPYTQDTHAITITITDVPDENLAPVTDQDATAGDAGIVAENSAIGSTVGISAYTVDGDAGQNISYVLSGADAALFDIDANGLVTTAAVLDHEAAEQRSFTVTATSSDGSSATKNFTVSVTDINETPVFVTGSTLPDADEDTAYSVTISTTDTDDADSRRFTIVSLPAWLTLVDSGNGTAVLSGTPEHSDNGVHDIILDIEDSAGLTSSRTFSLTVNNTNDGTYFTSADTFTVTENTTAVADITSEDEDGDPPSYGIHGGDDAALFSIDATTGALTFNTAPDFDNPQDSDGDNSYTVTISVDDNAGPPYFFAIQTLTITVADIPDEGLTPVIDEDPSAGSQGMVDENSVIGTLVGITANSVDGDVGQSVSYALSGTDAALFSIDDNGVVTTAVVLDHEAADSHSFSVTATSSDGSTAARDFTVSVSDINEAPIFVTGTVLPDAIEDKVYTVNISSSDPDSADTRAFTGISLPGWMTMVDNGDGTATLSGTPQQSDTGTHSIILEVEDAAGLKSTRTFSLSVDNVNDAPVITSPSAFTMAENSRTVDTLTVSDADGNTPLFSIATSGGADSTLFSIDATTGVLSFITAPDFDQPQDADGDNTYELTISVDDGSGSPDAITTQDITVTVGNLADENLAPITDLDTTAGAQGMVDENSAPSTLVGIEAFTVDGDTGQSISYSLSGSDAALFSIDGHGVVRTAAPLNHESAPTRSFTVTATSSDGSTAERAFTVAVNDLNEVPTFLTGTLLPDAAEDSDYIATINTADPDSTDTLAFNIISLPAWLTVNDNGDGTATLTGTPQQSDNGAATLTLEIEDAAGLKSTRTFSLTVNSVNDAPVNTSPDSFTIAENNETVATLTASDADGDTPSFAIVGGVDGALFSIDANTGVLSFTVAPDFDNPQDSDKDNLHELTISVDDGTGSPDAVTTQTITVTVTNLADEDLSPITDSDTVAGDQGMVDENSVHGTLVGIVATATDGDSGQIISYALSGTDGGLFSIDNDGVVRTAAVLDHETADIRSFIVTATSSDGSTATRSFTVTIIDINEAPAFITATVLPEATVARAYSATISTSDQDSPETLTFNVIDLPAWLTLVDHGDGTATVSGTAQQADIGSATITVQIEDAGGLGSTRTFSLNVNSINTSPVSTSPDTVTVAENATAVATITASDADGDQPVFSLLGGSDEARFNIDANTGELRFISAPDFEAPQDADADNSYELIIGVDDGSGSTNALVTQSITVTVTNLSDEDLSPIVDQDSTAGAQGRVDEGTAIGTLVGIRANTTDGDAGQSISYTLTGPDAALFSIDDNGVVTTAAVLDHEAASEHRFTVTARSSDGSTTERQFLVSVSNINEAPVITSADRFSVDENTRAVAAISATDTDGDELMYSLSGGTDASLFTLDANTGELYFKDSPDFETPQDANRDNRYEVAISATDSRNASSTQILLVSVADINESPSITTTDIQSTTDHNGNIGSLSITDPDTGDIVELSIIGGNAASSFSYDKATDQLRQNAHLDEGTYTLEVMLVDSSGNTTQATLTISILSDPTLQAALPDTRIDTIDIAEITDASPTDTSTLSEVELPYDRNTEFGRPPARAPAPVESSPSVEETVPMEVDQTASSEEARIWSDPTPGELPDDLTDELTDELLRENQAQANIEQANSTEQQAARTESGEKARLLALMDGLQKSGLVVTPSIIDRFQMLPFQLSLMPSLYEGNDRLSQELSEGVREQHQQQQFVVAVGTGASVALTAGFVSWLLKAGVLISTAKSSAPLWSAIDPVPVLRKQNLP